MPANGGLSTTAPIGRTAPMPAASRAPRAWNDLKGRAKNQTHRWDTCSWKPGVELPIVAPGLVYSRTHNVYLSPWSVDSPQTGHGRKRSLTWEDTINVTSRNTSFSAGAPDEVLDFRRGRGACAHVCHYLPIPLSIGTAQRPVRGFMVRLGQAGLRYFAVGIEKCASSTLSAFFSEFWAALNATSPWSKETMAHCTNMSYSAIAAEVANATSPESTVTNSTEPSGCGHAASFDLRRSTPTFSFAVVREPVGRFITALDPHAGKLPTQSQNLPSFVESLFRQSEAMMRVMNNPVTGSHHDHYRDSIIDAGRTTTPVRHPTDSYTFDGNAHFRTQSYFLAGTDLQGNPIKWDAILRIEEMATIGAAIAKSMLAHARSEWSWWRPHPEVASEHRRLVLYQLAHAAKSEQLWRHVNAKSDSHGGSSANTTARDHVMRAVLNHSRLSCNLCHIYGQDFSCLGYPFPPACYEPECARTLPPATREAMGTRTAAPSPRSNRRT